MWNAFMNGSALPGGGGAGGGNVPSQGWEFVPSSRMDRGSRGKCRNPLRRISSPPTVFSHIYEPQGGGDVGAGTQLELLRGQMWPGPEPQPQQQQAQHTRLKKKFEDLKKRHVQDKEEWMREKESLLREVADIQGGENRRILLDLKTVLDEVQTEVKREEERRSELQLQYTTDRCAWELEKAELKCRIAQLEASRESAGLVSGGVQSAAAAAGPGSVACSAGETLRWERAEQRRLLADTRSTAMDLRCRMDHNERDWTREKAELLERFNVERKEWESQLKDMQKKIEELYCEVRAKREGTGLDMRRHEKEDVLNRFSMRSSSNRSSLLSDNSRSEPLSSSSQSEPIRHSPLPGFGCNRNISASGGGVGTDSHHSTCLQADSLCEFNYGGHYTPNDHSQPELVDGLRSRGSWQQDSVAESDEAVDTTELEAIFNATPGCGVPQNKVPKYNDKNVHASLQENALWAELSHCSEKKKNTTALNAALKEIARVSEELCSYQDEIRKKSGDTRNHSETLCLPGENEMLFGQNNNNKAQLEVDEDPCDLSQIYADLRALEKENWITSSPDNTWRANREPCKSRRENTDLDSNRETQTSPGFLYEIDTAAPPIPPRKSSQSTPTLPDIELHIPESPTTTVKHCHSPCVLVDRKCSSPSIVRKFGAMLQVNEGKVLVDGVVTSCDIPSNPNCNFGCCHNRWSCDATKFTNSKSAHDTVQKSFSEVNILTAGKDFHSLHSPAVGNLKELQIPPAAKEVPVDVLLSSLEISPACLNLQGSKRNIVLEQKTAEFNKTLFQAEMGRGVEKQERFPPTDACSVGCQPGISATCASDEVLPPGETTFQPHCTDVTRGMMGVYPGVTLSLSASDSTSQKPEVQLRKIRSCSEGQEVSMKQEISSDLSFEKALTGLREATTIISQCEVKHKVGTASVPSRKTQRRVATEALFSEPVFSANTQPGQNGDASSTKKESPHGAKPQPARVAVSLQQLSAENKRRQTTQAGHQTQPKHLSDPPSLSDPSRPGPRMMNDHPWKPGTLAAYPRPEGSRSNYGALERILKSYENAARAQQNHSQQENVMELDIDPLPIPPTLRATQTSHTSQTHTTHAQLSSHSAMSVKEIHLTVQENEESSSVQKNFSRPARPANRRLPSRWASRSSISSSTSTSSSPSTTPVVPPSVPLYKHSSSFTYSQAFHMETVII